MVRSLTKSLTIIAPLKVAYGKVVISITIIAPLKVAYGKVVISIFGKHKQHYFIHFTFTTILCT